MRNKLIFYLVILILLTVFSTRVTAQDCYESSIISPSPFMGNNGEIFKLKDGSLWKVKYEYKYLYKYYPAVIICPSKGRLVIDGESLNVTLVSAAENHKSATTKWEIYEETNLKGSISGTIRKGHIFKTTSANIYEVTGLTLQLVLELQPDVIVLRDGDTYKLIVDGFDEPLICKCISKSSTQRYVSPNNKYTDQSNTAFESTIISDFDGLDYGNIYKLANGQIWEQTEYWIWIWIWINPSVIIWNDGVGFKMKVDQINHAVKVKRIN